MEPPKISIVIPSFNKVKFIGLTLSSIFSQNYPDLEVIVQDGGSTDGTLGIIKKYAQKYPRNLQWESKKDKGQLDAINKGFKKATGELLTFINADDIYSQDAFKEVVKLYQANPHALWFAGRGRVINSTGDEIGELATWYKDIYLSLNLYPGLLIFNYLMQPSVFISRKAWKEFGPFSGTKDFVVEYGLWLKIAKCKMPVVSGKTLSSFRIESSTISKTMTNKLLLEDEKAVQKYSNNPIIFSLHKLHNFARRMMGRMV